MKSCNSLACASAMRRQSLHSGRTFVTYFHVAKKKKLNSVALDRKRNIPTERPPLVGEVCQLLRVEGAAWSAQRIPTTVNLGFLLLHVIYFHFLFLVSRANL
jgi:hypothetical protein